MVRATVAPLRTAVKPIAVTPTTMRRVAKTGEAAARRSGGRVRPRAAAEATGERGCAEMTGRAGTTGHASGGTRGTMSGTIDAGTTRAMTDATAGATTAGTTAGTSGGMIAVEAGLMPRVAVGMEGTRTFDGATPELRGSSPTARRWVMPRCREGHAVAADN